jgi:hypothetical protein
MQMRNDLEELMLLSDDQRVYSFRCSAGRYHYYLRINGVRPIGQLTALVMVNAGMVLEHIRETEVHQCKWSMW